MNHKARRASRSYFQPVVYSRPFLAFIGLAGAAIGFGVPWALSQIARFLIHTF